MMKFIIIYLLIFFIGGAIFGRTFGEKGWLLLGWAIVSLLLAIALPFILTFGLIALIGLGIWKLIDRVKG